MPIAARRGVLITALISHGLQETPEGIAIIVEGIQLTPTNRWQRPSPSPTISIEDCPQSSLSLGGEETGVAELITPYLVRNFHPPCRVYLYG